MNEYTNKNKYDLEERTSLFGENIIDLCKIIPRNEIISTIIKQLIRSATSTSQKQPPYYGLFLL